MVRGDDFEHDIQKEATTSSSAISSNLRSLARRVRSPPKSLPDHFSRKGYLSVSDLIGPSWCEYSYQYGVLSLSHLPPSQRPQSITTESGQTLSASVKRVQEREKVLEGGIAVHTVLERQVAPVQVTVQTETREDTWALRLLNIWCDVQALLQIDTSKSSTARGKAREKKCVREVPVYGWIHGAFVMGVIDEIEKRSTAPQSQEKPVKTWSSQEDWKREQQRKPKLSPTKTKAAAKGHTPLTAFFQLPSTPEPAVPESVAESVASADPRWSYFLSDNKTRIASWLPAEEDQYGSRMQCMTYRRLFDGLCLGAVLAQQDQVAPRHHVTSSNSSNDCQFDPFATPMDWVHTFVSENINQDLPLSDAFLIDAVSLCESWGTDLFSFTRDKCTLNDIRLLLEHGLRELVSDARKGQGEPIDAMSVGVLQSELALNYRQQKRHRSKRKTTATRSPQKARKAQSKAESKTIPGQLQPTLDAVLTARTVGQVDFSQAREAPLIPDVVSDKVRQSMDAIEGHNEVAAALSQAFSTPSSSPRKPLALPQPTSNSEMEMRERHDDGSEQSDSVNEGLPSIKDTEKDDESMSTTIGVVRFQHSSANLETHLSRILALWKGERPLEGVNIWQTKRCWNCEWRDDCEWRTIQSDAALQQASLKVAVESQQLHDGQGQATIAGSDEEGFWNDLDYSAIQVKDQGGNVLDW